VAFDRNDPVSAAVIRPRNVAACLDLIAEPGVRILAGGTDLVVQAKEGVVAEAIWVDVSALEEIRGIEETPRDVRIGAATTHAEIVESPVIRRRVPALPMACRWVGSPQIQNAGTLGGNLANASPAGDALPALWAADAVVHVRSRRGRRAIPVAAFMLGPRRTALKRGEMITQISIPKRPAKKARSLGAFVKIGSRRSLAISKVMVGVHALAADGQGRPGGRIVSIGIGLGAVAPTILRAREAERLVAGREVTPDIAAEAGALAAAAAKPIDDVRSTAAYRRRATAAAVERALLALATWDDHVAAACRESMDEAADFAV
jgi:CO/xanthine dehydrogenase FAD-binding subunit